MENKKPIKEIMDNYDHETASEEDKEEAAKFLNYLERTANLNKVLKEIEAKELELYEKKKISWKGIKRYINNLFTS